VRATHFACLLGKTGPKEGVMNRRTRAFHSTAASLLLLGASGPFLSAVERPAPGAEDEAPGDAARGKNFLPTARHSLEDDRALLRLFDGLRVADVSDGMDVVGLQDVGLMDPKVGPLWRDLENFTHRV